MMIGKMRYDADGDLLGPTERDLRLGQAPYNDPPTLDPGYWHRVKVTGRNKDQLARRMRSVIEELGAIPNLGVWRHQAYTVPAVDGGIHEIVDIVYCVAKG